jgi:hypothetical protein
MATVQVSPGGYLSTMRCLSQQSTRGLHSHSRPVLPWAVLDSIISGYAWFPISRLLNTASATRFKSREHSRRRLRLRDTFMNNGGDSHHAGKSWGVYVYRTVHAKRTPPGAALLHRQILSWTILSSAISRYDPSAPPRHWEKALHIEQHILAVYM